MKKWQKQIGWTLLGALVVAIIAAWFRNNRDTISAIPGVGDVFNYVMPDTGGFNMPSVNIPGLVLPDTGSGVVIPDRNGMQYPKANSCGCGTSRKVELVLPTKPVEAPGAVNILPPPMRVQYEPPPCVMQTDYDAMGAPGTSLGNWYRGPRGLKSKHYNELQSAGYSPSVANWMRYVMNYPRGIAGNQNRSDQVRAINAHKGSFQRCM